MRIRIPPGVFLGAMVFGPAVHADINLLLLDAAGKPVPGISCAQTGGSSALSDAQGRLVLPIATSGLAERMSPEGHSPTRVPLAPGEKAALMVTDLRGRIVRSRTLGPGERFEIPPTEKGVYAVRIASPRLTVSGKVVNLGKGIVFEGVPAVSRAASLRKPAAGSAGPAGPYNPVGPEVVVVCSRAGSPSRTYRIADGTSLTLDFSRPALVPLHDESTPLEAENVFETATAVVTRFSDRARDRHAREDQFQAYDHYLALYWEFRTATIQITDHVAKGGSRIRVDQWTLWPLDPTAREFRAFYRGIGTVAEYHYNASMQVDPADPLHYFVEFDYNGKTGKKIAVGDRMEIEVSQFLAKEGLEGRDNYYGTTYLYIVGQGGLVPWETKGVFGDAATEREDSHPLPEAAWLGGRTTVHQQYTDEPDDVFMQMATNLAPRNGQVFVKGRRMHHTSLVDGSHDEPGNPVWTAQAGKAGPYYVNSSCTACHHKNARALPPAVGGSLDKFVIKVADADGAPHPQLGSVLQPRGAGVAGEGQATLASWSESDGLRKPVYAFSGTAPPRFSSRIAPQLVGMGLLEAVSEARIQALADPDDADKDGISGRMHIVPDYGAGGAGGAGGTEGTGQPRLGRFGWKAGKPSVAHQVAGALNTDIGVMSSLYPQPDCGSVQSGCGNTAGAEIGDEDFKNLVDYIALLGVRARRDIGDPEALQGEALFMGAGCAACHVPTLTTGAFHPKAELRNQVIRPYTDLLLHDMGPELADNLGEGDASGSEWRTAPLWNIGLTAGASGGEAYLHDGRARSLQEAILWHGGEGAAAAARFKAMSSSESAALIRFLKSL